MYKGGGGREKEGEGSPFKGKYVFFFSFFLFYNLGEEKCPRTLWYNKISSVFSPSKDRLSTSGRMPTDARARFWSPSQEPALLRDILCISLLLRGTPNSTSISIDFKGATYWARFYSTWESRTTGGSLISIGILSLSWEGAGSSTQAKKPILGFFHFGFWFALPE